MQFEGPEACSNASVPVQLSFSSAAISLVLALITSSGNFLICLVVAKDPNKNLKTPFNLFIVNIAIADLLAGSIVLPLSMAFHVCEGLGMFYPELIKALHLSVFVTCTASVLGICSLSFDRYLAITSPLKYRTRLTSAHVKKTTALIWTVAVIMSLLYIRVDFILYTFVYVNVIILFTVVLLLIVQFRVSRALRAPRTSGGNSFDFGSRINKTTSERNARVTKAFVILLLVFFSCNFPSLIIIYTMNFCQSCDCLTIQVLRDFGFLSLMIGSAINPLYYGLRLPHFKTALKKLLAGSRRQSRAGGAFYDSTLSGDTSANVRVGFRNRWQGFELGLNTPAVSEAVPRLGPIPCNKALKHKTGLISLPVPAFPKYKNELQNESLGTGVVLTRIVNISHI